jgi:hypothetical protein
MNTSYSLLCEIVFITSVNRSFQEAQNLWKTMKHPEKIFISAKILWGTREYTFLTHTVSATQGYASVTSRLEHTF